MRDIASLVLAALLLVVYVLIIMFVVKWAPRGNTRCVSTPACICRTMEEPCWDQR